MRRRCACLAAAFALAVAIAACSSATSDELPPNADSADATDANTVDDATADVTRDGAPACTLPGTYGSKQCMSCVGATCCDEVTTCANDEHCKPLQECVLGCLPKPDAGGCLDDCLATYPAGKTLWEDVDHCWFGKPPAGCLVECTN